MQLHSPDYKLSIRMQDEWDGVTVGSTHYVRVSIDTRHMVATNHRMSEAQAYARQYRAELLKSLRLPEGYTAHAEPDTQDPPRLNAPTNVIIATPPFTDAPGLSPHATPAALSQVALAVQAAHEAALLAVGNPPDNHSIAGAAGFRARNVPRAAGGGRGAR